MLFNLVDPGLKVDGFHGWSEIDENSGIRTEMGFAVFFFNVKARNKSKSEPKHVIYPYTLKVSVMTSQPRY